MVRKSMTIDKPELYRGYYRYERWDFRSLSYITEEGYVGPYTTVGPVKGALNNELGSYYRYSDSRDNPNIIHEVRIDIVDNWKTHLDLPPKYPV